MLIIDPPQVQIKELDGIYQEEKVLFKIHLGKIVTQI